MSAHSSVVKVRQGTPYRRLATNGGEKCGLDLELLESVSRFTLEHPHPQVAGFKPAMRNWGSDWKATSAAYLPAGDILAAAEKCSDATAQPLLRTFARHNQRLRWEQSYRKQDGLVPDAMLAAYGFAEIIGLRGPFVSDRIRAGIAIWGAQVDYPQHQHQAEEVYIVLAGSAEFSFDNHTAQTRSVGDVVFVESNQRHGFRTADESLVVFYLWQAGDLRQTSSFV
jgi:mannose-6-phosphate isomerase-like protein (cupin superfamily)